MEHQGQSLQPTLPASLTPIKVPSHLRLARIVSYVVKFWVVIGIVALTLRVFLLLASANPATPFVNFIYNLSADYMRPFTGIFPAKAVSESGYFDVSATFAIIVYLFLMWGISELISYIDTRIQIFKAQKRAELEALEILEKERQQKLEQQQLATFQAQQTLDNEPVTVAATVATDTVVHTQELKQSKPRKAS